MWNCSRAMRSISARGLQLLGLLRQLGVLLRAGPTRPVRRWRPGGAARGTSASGTRTRTGSRRTRARSSAMRARAPQCHPRACPRGQRGAPRYSAASPSSCLDAQQLVVLRDAVAARGRAGLDLAAVRRDREVGDRRVLGLAAAVRHHATCSRARVASATVSSVSVSVPIWFTFTRIELATPLVDATRQPLGVGHEQVVADELHRRRRAASVSAAQPSQSSSAMPSSIETIG